MAGKALLEKIMSQKNKSGPTLSITKQKWPALGSKKNKTKKLPPLLLLQAKDQKLKEQEKSLKAKERALKEYKKIMQKSSQLIKEVTETLAWQLKMAQEIHHILLPSELPVIPGCEFSFKFQPAEQEGAGKDFYEISPHPAFKSFSLTLSSSASHSLAVLLFSARLKMMSRIERGKPLLPEEFLNQLREELNQTTSWARKIKPTRLSALPVHLNQAIKPEPLGQRDLKPGAPKLFKTLSLPVDKISFFHALINQKTYQMCYTLTGNIVALVHYAERGVIKKLTQSPDFLNKASKKQLVYLNGRDKLVVLSPGVFQTRSLEGKQYTLSKVKKILKEEKTSSVHEIRNRIFYELKAFSKSQPSKSDQSVLVMEVQHQTLKLAT